MKKSRSDASWNLLLPEARQTLEAWLFDDRLNYEQALARAQAELGYTGSLTSLKRFYSRLAQERILDGFTDARTHARKIEGVKTNVEELRNAGLKVMAQSFLKQITEAPDQVKQWGWLAKLLLQSEENELKRSLTAEHHELRRQSLHLARERWEYNVVEQACHIWPMLRDLARVRKQPKPSKYAEEARMLAIRLRIFGETPPPYQPTGYEANPEILAEARRILLEEKREYEAELARRAREEALDAAAEAGQHVADDQDENSNDQDDSEDQNNDDDQSEEDDDNGRGRPLEL